MSGDYIAGGAQIWPTSPSRLVVVEYVIRASAEQCWGFYWAFQPHGKAKGGLYADMDVQLNRHHLCFDSHSQYSQGAFLLSPILR